MNGLFIVSYCHPRASTPENEPDMVSRIGQDITIMDAAAHDAVSNAVPIDMDMYIKRMNGNKKIATDILSGFLKLLPGDIARIGEAIESGNAHDANRLAHSIKGGGRNVCASELGEAARRLEESLELGICDDAQTLLNDLRKARQRLNEYVAAIKS